MFKELFTEDWNSFVKDIKKISKKYKAKNMEPVVTSWKDNPSFSLTFQNSGDAQKFERKMNDLGYYAQQHGLSNDVTVLQRNPNV